MFLNQCDFVYEYDIRKGKKVRHITAPHSQKVKSLKHPSSDYMAYLKRLNIFLQNNLPVHHAAYAWRKGINTKQLATKLFKHKVKYSIDIKTYFDSMDIRLLKKMLLGIFDTDTVKTIMKYTTYRNGIPSGFPTSPSLGNFYRLPIDVTLDKLAQDLDLEYFAYGDDLLFGGDFIPYNLKYMVHEIVKPFNLSVNFQKSKLLTVSKSHEILGMTINKKVNIPKKYYEDLYGKLNIGTNGTLTVTDSLLGKIAYVKSISAHKHSTLLNALPSSFYIK